LARIQLLATVSEEPKPEELALNSGFSRFTFISRKKRKTVHVNSVATVVGVRGVGATIRHTE
jgi:hypothetical protein